jgi:hypothetical protein
MTARTKAKKSKKKEVKKQVITGYKVFNKNWKCRDFQFEVGKTFKHEGRIKLCAHGFHFCQELNNCFEYYDFNPENKIALVEVSGEIVHGDDKSVCSEITIISEIAWGDMLNIVNSGVGNTGRKNAGNENAGYKNAGNENAGNENAGYKNAGNENAGYKNAGNYNAGNYNAGNYNAGDFNSGSYNTGVFNTDKAPKIKIFDVDSDWTLEQWRESRACRILSNISFTEYVWHSSMTDEEKEKFPAANITGGYTKFIDYKDAWINFWNNLNDDHKKEIQSIPNFNPEKFFEITGVKI